MWSHHFPRKYLSLLARLSTAQTCLNPRNRTSEQLITGSTNRSGNCLDLLFTDVRSVVVPVIAAPIGGSDHSVISFKLIVDFEVPNITFSRTVHLKSRADWTGIPRDISNINWSTIYSSDSQIDSLNSAL